MIKRERSANGVVISSLPFAGHFCKIMGEVEIDSQKRRKVRFFVTGFPPQGVCRSDMVLFNTSARLLVDAMNKELGKKTSDRPAKAKKKTAKRGV